MTNKIKKYGDCGRKLRKLAVLIEGKLYKSGENAKIQNFSENYQDFSDLNVFPIFLVFSFKVEANFPSLWVKSAYFSILLIFFNCICQKNTLILWNRRDHIPAMNQINEKTKEFNIELWLMFIDFDKAFDSMYNNKLWLALAEQGVTEGIIKNLICLYSQSVPYVRTDMKGENFPKHDDPLFPNLFNCLLEQIFRNLGWEGKGLKILGKHLNNLRFADDIVLIVKNFTVIEGMVKEWKNQCKNFGLTMNLSKIHFMSNREEKKNFGWMGQK